MHPTVVATSTLAEIIGAFSGYAWPVVVALIVWKLLPTIRQVLATRGYTLKIGGVEVTVQQVARNLTKQIGDLQARTSALKLSLPPSPTIDTAPTAEGPARTLPPSPGGPTPRGGAAVRACESVLWVDDNLGNVAAEIEILQSRGVTVLTAGSTEEAMRHVGDVDAVVSDAQRVEHGRTDPHAGAKLVRRVRAAGFDLPVYIYTLAGFADLIRDDATAAGATAVITSSSDLLARLSPPATLDDDPA